MRDFTAVRRIFSNYAVAKPCGRQGGIRQFAGEAEAPRPRDGTGYCLTNRAAFSLFAMKVELLSYCAYCLAGRFMSAAEQYSLKP